jgi:hypothetical protein
MIVRRSTPFPVFIFFLIVLLGTWIGGIWMTPLGPTVRGVFWMPFFFAGLIFGLLLLAIIPQGPPRVVFKRKVQIDEEDTAEEVLSVFFWVLIFAMIVGIIARYVLNNPFI